MEIHTRAQAIALGLNRYFTGKACKRGHLAPRHMVGGCVICKRSLKNQTKRRKWHRADQVEARRLAGVERQRLAEIARAERVAKRSAEKAGAALLRAAQSAERKASAAARRREYYLANREERLARSRAHYQANKDRSREQTRCWRKKNPDKVREDKRRRRVSKRSSIISELSSLQRGRCAYCRERLTPASTHIDHIHPRAKGGLNSRRNYQLACAPCNISKSAKDPIAFSQERGMLI